jgi:hypothetical protein
MKNYFLDREVSLLPENESIFEFLNVRSITRQHEIDIRGFAFFWMPLRNNQWDNRFFGKNQRSERRTMTWETLRESVLEWGDSLYLTLPILVLPPNCWFWNEGQVVSLCKALRNHSEHDKHTLFPFWRFSFQDYRIVEIAVGFLRQTAVGRQRVHSWTKPKRHFINKPSKLIRHLPLALTLPTRIQKFSFSVRISNNLAKIQIPLQLFHLISSPKDETVNNDFEKVRHDFLTNVLRRSGSNRLTIVERTLLPNPLPWEQKRTLADQIQCIPQEKSNKNISPPGGTTPRDQIITGGKVVWGELLKLFSESAHNEFGTARTLLSMKQKSSALITSFEPNTLKSWANRYFVFLNT